MAARRLYGDAGGCWVLYPPKDGTFDGQDPVEQLGFAKNTVNHGVCATLACAFLVALLAATVAFGKDLAGLVQDHLSNLWCGISGRFAMNSHGSEISQYTSRLHMFEKTPKIAWSGRSG